MRDPDNGIDFFEISNEYSLRNIPDRFYYYPTDYQDQDSPMIFLGWFWRQGHKYKQSKFYYYHLDKNTIQILNEFCIEPKMIILYVNSEVKIIREMAKLLLRRGVAITKEL